MAVLNDPQNGEGQRGCNPVKSAWEFTVAVLSAVPALADKSELQLELTEIVVNGTAYPVLSGDYQVSGKSRGGQSAKRIWGKT